MEVLPLLGMSYQVDGGYSPRSAWGDRNDPSVPSSQETRTNTTPQASITKKLDHKQMSKAICASVITMSVITMKECPDRTSPGKQ